MTRSNQAPTDPRLVLAVVTGHLTPYRIAFHRRLVAEVPELRLATLVTRARTGPWVNPDVPDIGTVRFDAAAAPADQAGAEPEPPALPLHLWRQSGIARRVVAWLRRTRPAALICGGYDELPVLAALTWAARRRVPAFLWTDSNVHGDLATGLRRAVKNLYVPRVCSAYRGILVCGRAGKAFFHRYGVGDDRLFIMPVEPDYAAIEGMTDAEAERLTAPMGLAPGRRRLVCCCRLIALKRVDLVIDAFAALVAERPEWDLVIVGSGEERGALERRAAPLVRAERVRFLGFQVTREVAAIYRRSDALVLASDYEPWALVVNEAAAAGLALVCSDRVGAAYELVDPGRNGRVFPAGDAGALAAAVREVTDPARIDAMKRASLEQIARWRREADPVRGLRAALAAAGVLSAPA